MRLDDLLAILDGVLRPLGCAAIDGEVFTRPALEIVRFYQRPVRLHWLPIVGKAQSIITLVRQPADLKLTTEHGRELLRRAAMATSDRFPPWSRGGGSAIGLTLAVLTEDSITPQDDTLLPTMLVGLPRMRSIPLALFRLNLGQEAMSYALAGGPGNLFPEPVALADALVKHFRRFVPMIES